MDFKTVTGGANAIALNLSKGLKQAENVFLRIEQDFNVSNVYRILKNKLNVINKNGKLSEIETKGRIYVYLEETKKLYTWATESFLSN